MKISTCYEDNTMKIPITSQKQNIPISKFSHVQILSILKISFVRKCDAFKCNICYLAIVLGWLYLWLYIK